MAAQDPDEPPPRIIVIDDALSLGWMAALSSGRGNKAMMGLAEIVDRFNDSDLDPAQAIRDVREIFADMRRPGPPPIERREPDPVSLFTSRGSGRRNGHNGGRPSSAGAYKGSKAAKKATRPKKRPKGFNRRKGFRQ